MESNASAIDSMNPLANVTNIDDKIIDEHDHSRKDTRIHLNDHCETITPRSNDLVDSRSTMESNASAIDSSPFDYEISEYEKKRLDRIQQNHDHLVALGLHEVALETGNASKERKPSSTKRTPKTETVVSRKYTLR